VSFPIPEDDPVYADEGFLHISARESARAAWESVHRLCIFVVQFLRVDQLDGDMENALIIAVAARSCAGGVGPAQTGEYA
jgi:hypothetical protein